MQIQRILLATLRASLMPGKVLVLYGPRQVGKTTLAHELLRIMAEAPNAPRAAFINADELRYREALASQDRRILGDILADNQLLVIDEAQRVPNIGLNLKILVDSFPHATIIATGSASFDLANKISEPLIGRKLTLTLYPISYGELSATLGPFEARSQLERWLVWGGYPAIVTVEASALRERLLGELVGSYLYRDLLDMEGLRHPEALVDLLRLLAFQIGREVSLSELATSLGINRSTVARYLDLLEKVFVLFRVSGFSRNLRSEVTRNARYYFYDNGVRNALIQNFNPIALRDDVGQLWENWLVVERRKALAYAGLSANSYFWRTHARQELDYVEERGGLLRAFEFKWRSGRARAAAQREFLGAYPGAQVSAITSADFEEFVLRP